VALGTVPLQGVATSSRHSSLLSLIFFLSFLSPLTIYAETKVLTAEATYTMGDGETPSFAEAMALQKAKQMALEQAGTYVESYTRVQNYQLTADEIQTIAGGVLQVEILAKKRELIGDGMRHYVKIKATVTTDRIADLAQRVKNKNVAEKYKELQEDYARLAKEIDYWKQLASKTPSGPEHEAALDKIREREKAFSGVQKSEADFFQRLISGKVLLQTADREKAAVDRLVRTIINSGFVVVLGEAKAKPVTVLTDTIQLIMPMKFRISDGLISMLSDMATEWKGDVQFLGEAWVMDPGEKPLVGQKNSERVTMTLVRLSDDPYITEYFHDLIERIEMILQLKEQDGSASYCILGYEFAALSKRGSNRKKQAANIETFWKDTEEWSPIRRMFPVARRDGNSVSSFEYGVQKNTRWLKMPTTVSASDLYVAILHAEANFNVDILLPRSVAGKITGITARLISRDNLAQRKGERLECKVSFGVEN
jgi:hypothetical protein